MQNNDNINNDGDDDDNDELDNNSLLILSVKTEAR